MSITQWPEAPRLKLQQTELKLWERVLGLFMSAEHFETRHPSGLLDADGGVPSPRVNAREDHACEVPFGFAPEIDATQPIACIIHAFYPDMLPPLLGLLTNIPCSVDLFLSTDTVEKKAEIERLCRFHRQGKVELRLVENRGRDIAPKLITFRDVYARYELFLHLHTKRSPHSGSLSQWNFYLTETLLGSPEIVRSILRLLHGPRVGLVFPQHLFSLRKALRWGFNYDHGRRLLGRLGIKLQADWPLEFPSGSMLWGRSAALKPLLDLDLAFEDFPDEAGQVDGTLAHAIERSLLHVVEQAGFEWIKIARRKLYPLPGTVLPVGDESALAQVRAAVFIPCLPPAAIEPAAGEPSVGLEFGTAETGRLIEIENFDQAARAGLLLWQRRNPVEAARWSASEMEGGDSFAARLTLGAGEANAAAWADAIEAAVDRFRAGG